MLIFGVRQHVIAKPRGPPLDPAGRSDNFLMRLSHVVLCSVAGMLVVGGSVYIATPAVPIWGEARAGGRGEELVTGDGGRPKRGEISARGSRGGLSRGTGSRGRLGCRRASGGCRSGVTYLRC